MEKTRPSILYCHCRHYDFIGSDKKTIVLEKLKKIDADIIITEDLCGSAVRKSSELMDLDKTQSLTILACHPRAVRWILNRIPFSVENKAIEWMNLRLLSAGEIADKMDRMKTNSHVNMIGIPVPGDPWIPWYPVIDYDRCKNCKQCMSFCLFGTYDTNEDGNVYVRNPQNCKTNCPACARICPEAAIIFPKYGESPVNGDEITDEEGIRAKIKLNVDEMLGNDVYAALAERRRKARLLKTRRDALKKAEEERKKYTS